LHRLYINLVVHCDYSPPSCTGSISTVICAATTSARRATRLTARRRLFRLRRASGCLCTTRGLSCDSSSTTSPPPHVRVPRHVARLIIDYFD
jgi:hypothetical protein